MGVPSFHLVHKRNSVEIHAQTHHELWKAFSDDLNNIQMHLSCVFGHNRCANSCLDGQEPI